MTKHLGRIDSLARVDKLVDLYLQSISPQLLYFDMENYTNDKWKDRVG
jgi:hypothetical protein